MNNEAHFGVTFGVKGAKQVQKAVDIINNRMSKLRNYIDKIGNQITNVSKKTQSAGKKSEEVFTKGKQKADKMSNSLDRLAKKWLTVGGAITLVSNIIRRAFARVDELTGLNRMAQSAGVASSKIYSLGKALKKYGADSSSAAQAYTSLNDILGGARAGKGINEDVVGASARYGIALNGGMLTEDQLMTNIAKAMQAQRNKGNMYGVRDIANAFGIDEAMMLHLSEKGANWDRGLPAANLKQAQEEAQKTQQLRDRLNELVNQLLIKSLPLINDAMQAILDLVNWLSRKFRFKRNDSESSKKNLPKDIKEMPTTKGWVVGGVVYPNMTKDEAIKKWEERLNKGKEKTKKRPTIQAPENPLTQGQIDATRIKHARDWAEYYNNLPDTNMSWALNNVKEILGDTGGVNAYTIPAKDGIKIIIEDKAGVLRNMNVYGQVGNSSNLAIATKN